VGAHLGEVIGGRQSEGFGGAGGAADGDDGAAQLDELLELGHGDVIGDTALHGAILFGHVGIRAASAAATTTAATAGSRRTTRRRIAYGRCGYSNRVTGNRRSAAATTAARAATPAAAAQRAGHEHQHVELALE